MTTPPSPDAGKKLPAGYKLQNYRIVSVLGEGGFGITYLAEDEVLHQKVAIKEYFPAALAHREAKGSALSIGGGETAKYFQWGLDRFVTEARILAKVSHPNIVRVLNFAQLNNTGYMVMPYEEGEPLDKWVRRFDGQGVPAKEVIALIDPSPRHSPSCTRWASSTGT